MISPFLRLLLVHDVCFFWLKSTKASPGPFFRANQSAAIVLFELNVVVGREIENLMFFFSPFKLISNLEVKLTLRTVR